MASGQTLELYVRVAGPLIGYCHRLTSLWYLQTSTAYHCCMGLYDDSADRTQTSAADSKFEPTYTIVEVPQHAQGDLSVGIII
jgi:hypothetical protein